MSEDILFGEPTRLLALVNQDWNIITSKHVFKMLSEFDVQNVKIYKNNSAKNEKNDMKNAFSYYIAVAEFLNVQKAEEAYNCFDGTEILHTDVYLDFRFINQDFITKNLGEIVCSSLREEDLPTLDSSVDSNLKIDRPSQIELEHNSESLESQRKESGSEISLNSDDQNAISDTNRGEYPDTLECLDDQSISESREKIIVSQHSDITSNQKPITSDFAFQTQNNKLDKVSEGGFLESCKFQKKSNAQYTINLNPNKKVVNSIKAVCYGNAENLESDDDFYDLSRTNSKIKRPILKKKSVEDEESSDNFDDDLLEKISDLDSDRLKDLRKSLFGDLQLLDSPDQPAKDSKEGKTHQENRVESSENPKLPTKTKSYQEIPLIKKIVTQKTQEALSNVVAKKENKKYIVDLDDERFAPIFVDNDFEIDVSSKKFKMDPTLRDILRKRRANRDNNQIDTPQDTN